MGLSPVDLGSVPDWVGLVLSFIGIAAGGLTGGYLATNSRLRTEDRRAALSIVSRLASAPQRTAKVQTEEGSMGNSHISEALFESLREWVADLNRLRRLVALLPLSDRLFFVSLVNTFPYSWLDLLRQVDESGYIDTIMVSGSSLESDSPGYQMLVLEGGLSMPAPEPAAGQSTYIQRYFWSDDWSLRCDEFEQYLARRLGPTWFDRHLALRILTCKLTISLWWSSRKQASARVMATRLWLSTIATSTHG